MTRIVSPELSSFTIGVIDDNPIDVMTLRAILQGNGFSNLIVFTDIKTAEAHLMMGNVVDLLFVDLSVQEQSDGLKFCKNLDDKLKAAIPVIVLTGSTNVEQKVAAMRAGVLNVISKPYTEDILISNVKAALKINFFSGRQKVRSKRIQQLRFQVSAV